MNTFNKIFNKILLNENIQKIDDYYSKIFEFSISPKGQEIQDLIQKSFQHKLNQYIKLYPEFANVSLEYNLDSLQDNVHAYIKNPGEEQPIIVINTFQIFELAYYGKPIDDILDWHDYTNHTIAHELAHILVFKKHKYKSFSSKSELHNKFFDKEFYKLSGKHLSDIPTEPYSSI